jgi:hypothetical protein
MKDGAQYPRSVFDQRDLDLLLEADTGRMCTLNEPWLESENVPGTGLSLHDVEYEVLVMQSRRK